MHSEQEKTKRGGDLWEAMEGGQGRIKNIIFPSLGGYYSGEEAIFEFVICLAKKVTPKLT